jgi:hypothetical protein
MHIQLMARVMLPPGVLQGFGHIIRRPTPTLAMTAARIIARRSWSAWRQSVASRISGFLLLNSLILLFNATPTWAWEIETTEPDSFGHSSLTVTGDIIDAKTGEALIITCISVNWIFSTENWAPDELLFKLPQLKGSLSIQSGSATATLPVHGTVWNKGYGAYVSDDQENVSKAVALLRSKGEYISVSVSLLDGTEDHGKIYSDETEAAAPDKFDTVCKPD